MITEDYVSFEVAKLLKEKRFDEPCFMSYWLRTKDRPELAHLEQTSNNYSDCVSCPTLQMAMKWLREEGFHINATISYDYSEDVDGNIVDKWVFWLFEIFSSFGGDLIYTEEVNEYDSYEEAVEAALKYSLENLI